MRRILPILLGAALLAGCGEKTPEPGAPQGRGDLEIRFGVGRPVIVSCPSGLPAEAELCRQTSRFIQQTGGTLPAGNETCGSITDLRGRMTPVGQTDSVRVFVPGWGCKVAEDAYPELRQAVEALRPDPAQRIQ